MFRHLAAEGGSTGNRPFRGQAVAVDLDGLRPVGSTAVVLVVVVDVRQIAVRIGPEVTDILAADDDGEAFAIRAPHQGCGGEYQRQGDGFVCVCHPASPPISRTSRCGYGIPMPRRRSSASNDRFSSPAMLP